MIRIQVDPKSINVLDSLVNSKISQANELIGPQSLSEIAKAVFTLTSKQFIRDISAAALEDPQSFHHIYEWSSVGNSNQKLFRIKRTGIQNGNLKVSLEMLKSTKPTPIDPILKASGPTGKSVNSNNVFREKASVMEDGSPIHYETKKTIAFSPNNVDMVFVGRGKVIDIMNPGGKKTAGSFKKFSEKWYANSAPVVISNSRLLKNIEQEVINELNKSNSNKQSIRSRVKRVASKYSDGDAVTF